MPGWINWTDDVHDDDAVLRKANWRVSERCPPMGLQWSVVTRWTKPAVTLAGCGPLIDSTSSLERQSQCTTGGRGPHNDQDESSTLLKNGLPRFASSTNNYTVSRFAVPAAVSAIRRSAGTLTSHGLRRTDLTPVTPLRCVAW